MKSITIILLSFLTFYSTEKDKEKIVWSETRMLNWSDFKGVPDHGADFVASTNSGLTFSYSYTEKQGEKNFEFTVHCNFYPNLSWYKEDQVSEYILRHEQAHFDISELHARVLRKRLSESVFTEDIKKEVEAIYNRTELQRGEMQDKFDLQTAHSRRIESEAQWEAFILKQLKVYERWK